MITIRAEDIHVCHLGTWVMLIGEKADCIAYKETQTCPNNWAISTIEEFGSMCWDDGFDTGYDAGRDEAEVL